MSKLEDRLISVNSNGLPANVVDGLFAIAGALHAVADRLRYLGNGDASTHMGAIEAHSKHMGEMMEMCSEAVSGALEAGSSNVAEALYTMADAIKKRDGK
jgi:hypothetical protein